MCGIVGVISKAPVNQLIYDALLLLQHRGQDAAGIVTMQGTKCFMHKARGMVRDVFRTRNMRGLAGQVAHVAGAKHVAHHAARLVHEAAVVLHRNDARCILAAMLQQQQRVVDELVDGRIGDHADDAAHGEVSLA